MFIRKIIVLALLWFLIVQRIQAQTHYHQVDYSFAVDDQNQFINPKQLSSVMSRLYEVKTHKSGSLSILHIGDSHLQADMMTAVIREQLQSQFGNAGRGLVVPLNVARTNEPTNYHSSSTSRWQSKRCVFPNQPLPVGIGGVTINTYDSSANLTLTVRPDSLLDYRFSKVSVFTQPQYNQITFRAYDPVHHKMAELRQDPVRNSPCLISTQLGELTDNVVIETQPSVNRNAQTIIYGVLLENGKPGVLYNTVGVNGAKYEHYLAAEYFAEQTAALKPDLIILSLGTNEAFGFSFDENAFRSHAVQLIQKLSRLNPTASFLLTTPAMSFFNKRPNSNLVQAANAIRKIAMEYGWSCWDLLKATGGEHSARLWKAYGLLRPDGVHYTKAGYEFQGKLFLNAFLTAYQNYVSNRP